MTVSAIPYAVLTLVIVGLFLIAMGPVIDAFVSNDNATRALDLPYSAQRGETMDFLLMCWGALAFSSVFGVVIFLLMNGAQRKSGGI